MFKVLSFLLLLLILATPVSAEFDYMDQKNFGKNMYESYKENPELWHITNDEIVYAKTRKDLESAIDRLYPEYEQTSIIVMHVNLDSGYSGGTTYVNFKKPKSWGTVYKHKTKDVNLFKNLRKMFYLKYKGEVGMEVDRETIKEKKLKKQPVVIIEDERKNRL